MSDQEKGKMINDVIGAMRAQATAENRPFDGGTLFFDLVFMEDDNLRRVAKLCGVA